MDTSPPRRSKKAWQFTLFICLLIGGIMLDRWLTSLGYRREWHLIVTLLALILSGIVLIVYLSRRKGPQ